MNELIEILEKSGLTRNEAKVYLVLLEEGISTTGKIIKKSKVSGSKTYEVLDRLIDKGLVSMISKNKVMHFEAAPPQKILDFLEEKRQSIEAEKVVVKKALPQFILRQNASTRSEAKLFTGFEGIKTVTQDIIATLKRNEEWLSMGLSAQPKEWEIYFTKKQKDRAAKGIIIKHLLNEHYSDLYHVRRKIPKTYVRFLPKELEMPTSTEIYANKVIIMVLSQAQPLALLIENDEIAKSFRKYFYVLWKSARRIE